MTNSTYRVSRRPFWQPNLIAISSKRTAFGIFSLDVPLVAGPLAWNFFCTQGLQVYLPAGVYDLINFEADLSLPRRGISVIGPNTLVR